MVEVLQASAWYPPVHLGGTEVYLTGLVHELRPHGVVSTIVAPHGSQYPEGYSYDGAVVRTYRVSMSPTRAELRGVVPQEQLSRFRDILAEVQPDVYHQHSWTRGLGLAHLRVARELGLRTVLTAHLPGIICLRGTMMKYGAQACDGRIDPFECAACWSHDRGAPKPVALALAAISAKLGEIADRAIPRSRLTTALGASAMVERVHSDVTAMANYADRIVAVSQWLYDALLLNGVPREKVMLSRQGVDCEFATMSAATAESSRAALNRGMPRKFRLLCLGRWQPLKGVDVVVRAVRALPTDVPLELMIHCLGDGAEERSYEATVRRIAAKDRRVRIAEPVPRALLAETFIQADAIAVPSRCLETGPLIVLEAKAAGLPVLGSRLGGIAELVREPDDGILVPPNDVAAWAEGILRMMARAASGTIRTHSKVRTMRDVAADMSALYRDICDAPARDGAVSCVSH